jgi:hypothetical protein
LDRQRIIMQLRRLPLRIEPLGPFWFEDLVFFVVDESRRLSARAAAAATRLRRMAGETAGLATAFNPTQWLSPVRTAPTTALSAPARPEAPALEAPEAWALATGPLATAGAGANAAVTCHAAAGEQLDALAYVMARMRDDLRPIMTTARFGDDTVERLADPKALDTSIEALLELSRRNEATRPRDRVRAAA